MPSLLTDRAKAKTRARQKGTPRARIPHSPWQRLVDTRRQAKGLRWREFADLINDALDRARPGKTRARVKRTFAPVPFTSLYQWVTSAKGFPSPSSYPAELNAAIASVLGIDAAKLADAWIESRTGSPRPAHEVTRPDGAEGLAELIEILQQGDSVTVNRRWVINTARRIQLGITHDPEAQGND